MKKVIAHFLKFFKISIFSTNKKCPKQNNYILVMKQVFFHGQGFFLEQRRKKQYFLFVYELNQ